jgi:prepilin-type processing-associated H-X9-DG protein
MKIVNTALLTYVNEFDTYPILFRVNPNNCNSVSWATWSFGGWTGKDFQTYCNAEGVGTHCYQTYQRPLSVYLLEPTQVLPDDKGPDGVFGTGDDRTTELPVFRCPADAESTQWRWHYANWETADVPQDVIEMSAYEQCGSSYQMNYYWFYQARARSEVEPGPCFNLRRWNKAFELGRRVWRNADEQGGASRFVTLVEDPFDWGIAQDLNLSANPAADPTTLSPYCGEQAMGYHGRWSWHNTAFLDGHVEYLFNDTRYQRDAHWTVTNEQWHDTRRRENCPQAGGGAPGPGPGPSGPGGEE